MSKRFDELVTARMLRDQTGLPQTTVRSILRNAARDGVEPVDLPLRTKIWRRRDVEPYFSSQPSGRAT